MLTAQKVRSVLQRQKGTETLVTGLLYGSGLRLLEALRLRGRELDFSRQELTVRDGKGGRDGGSLLPVAWRIRWLPSAEGEDDPPTGSGGWLGTGHLPHALARMYPNAPVEWGWQ